MTLGGARGSCVELERGSSPGRHTGWRKPRRTEPAEAEATPKADDPVCPVWFDMVDHFGVQSTTRHDPFEDCPMMCFAQRSTRLVLVALVAAFTSPTVALRGQAPAAAPSAPAFDKTDVMIPMRDGVKLHTTIFVPKGSTENLPFLFVRTPYGIDGGERNFAGPFAELVRDGYIFAFQDIRGRYKSEGQFVMLRQMRNKKDPKAIDESTDTYDTIEWLLKNEPRNNGRVGMMGLSYPGWLTVVAMLDPHPALKAVSPQASPADMYLGDDFHHNGAFRLSYGFEYVAMMETDKENAAFPFDRRDTYDWYLRLGALSNVNAKHFHNKYPTWN